MFLIGRSFNSYTVQFKLRKGIATSYAQILFQFLYGTIQTDTNKSDT